MTHARLVYLCNAIDDFTCRERGITSDSPAATQKVLQISSALADTGVRPIVLSMGRGRQNGSWRWHRAQVRRTGRRVIVVYAPFFDAPFLTHLVTMLCLLPLVWRLTRQAPAGMALLVYNRLPYYLPSIELAHRLGCRLFLDLEDGHAPSMHGLSGRFVTAIASRINSLCVCGALLATSSLASQYSGPRTLCCYGVAGASGPARQWGGKLRVLLGGTLQHDSGASLFIEAVAELRRRDDPAFCNLEFIVTGKGPMAKSIEALALAGGCPELEFKGRLSRESYRDMLDNVHIGLSLNLGSSDLGYTTFPSKVIQIASSGMLLLTTRVSDIPRLLNEEEALYLSAETPQALADALHWILSNREHAAAIASRGKSKIKHICSQEQVGRKLKSFFFSS